MDPQTSRSKYVLQTLAATAAGALLLWLLLRKLNLDELWQTLRNGHYHLLWLIGIVSFASYWFRVQRWKLLLAAGDFRVKTSNALAALSLGYMFNLLLPRIGELSRCYVMRRREQVPFEQSLGTIILERLVDIVMLLLLGIITVLSHFDLLYQFALQNIIDPFRQVLQNSRFNPLLACLFVLPVIALFYFLRKKVNSGKWQMVWLRFSQGLFSLTRVQYPLRFMLHTAGIWFCYFLMTWLWCFTFDESSSMSPVSAFVVMIIGTLGRSVPVQGGGVGTYHFMASQAFMLFAISPTTALALAILIHGGQTIFTILMGLLSFIWLSIRQRVSGQESA